MSSTNSKRRISSNTASELPAQILVNFNPIIQIFSPDSLRFRYLYEGESELSRFVRAFTIQRVIELLLVTDVSQDCAEKQAFVWQVIVDQYEREFQLLNDLQAAYDSFDLLMQMVLEACDLHIRETLRQGNLERHAHEYLFHNWVSTYVAALTHEHMEPSKTYTP